MFRLLSVSNSRSQTAIVCCHETTVETITYRELCEAVAALSKTTQQAGVPPNGLVFLYAGHSVELVVGMLALSFVPIDPALPLARKLHILSSTPESTCIVTTASLWHSSDDFLMHLQATRTHSVISIAGTSQCSIVQACPPVESTFFHPSLPPCYVMFTSGTTGRPKAVRVPFSAVIDSNIRFFSDLFFSHSVDTDTLLMCAPPCFDPIVVEVFSTLAAGARLLIIPDRRIRLMPHLLADVAARHHVTVVMATPSLMARFATDDIRRMAASGLRVIALGGEPCPKREQLWPDVDMATFPTGFRMYNLYGTTECSVWATCQQIYPDVDMVDTSPTASLPLGEPLPGTDLEVRDVDTGQPFGERDTGIGQLWIGGEMRSCFVDGDDPSTVRPRMRPTGDIVRVDHTPNGRRRLTFVSRVDDVIKLFGQKVVVDDVERILMSALPPNCGVRSLKVLRLFSNDAASTLAYVVAVEDSVENSSNVRKEVEVLIRQTANELLVPVMRPSRVVVVSTPLPVNLNGKVDREALRRMVDSVVSKTNVVAAEDSSEHSVNGPTHAAVGSRDDAAKMLAYACKTICDAAIGFTELPVSGYFLEFGGSSIDAVRVVDFLLADLPSCDPQRIASSRQRLLTALQNRPLGAVVDEIWSVFSEECRSVNDRKRKRSRSPEISEKRARLVLRAVEPDGDSAAALVAPLWSVSRQGRIAFFGHTEPQVPRFVLPPNHVLRLRVAWRVDTGKCVDTSPLIVGWKTAVTGAHSTAAVPATEIISYFGSHSGVVTAVRVSDGRILWRNIDIASRIESSACLTADGGHVVIGSRDGSVSALCALSGRLEWRCDVGGEVKSSPCVDIEAPKARNWIWVGAHDGKLHAIDMETRSECWTADLGNKPVFSSPVIDAKRRRLYVGGHDGGLYCVDLGDNSTQPYVHWRFSPTNADTNTKGPIPLFSSPAIHITTGAVFIGSVDGHLYCVNTEGMEVWRYATGGPVFSSPLVVDNVVVVGSHDGFLHCIDLATGALHWKVRMGAEVYSSPTEWPVGCASVCSTRGKLVVVGIHSGVPLAELQLGGDVFSSPVGVGPHLVVGCRDDFVYGVEVERL